MTLQSRLWTRVWGESPDFYHMTLSRVYSLHTESREMLHCQAGQFFESFGTRVGLVLKVRLN